MSACGDHLGFLYGNDEDLNESVKTKYTLSRKWPGDHETYEYDIPYLFDYLGTLRAGRIQKGGITARVEALPCAIQYEEQKRHYFCPPTTTTCPRQTGVCPQHHTIPEASIPANGLSVCNPATISAYPKSPSLTNNLNPEPKICS